MAITLGCAKTRKHARPRFPTPVSQTKSGTGGELCRLRSVEFAQRILTTNGLSRWGRRPPETRSPARYRALDITARRMLLMRVE